jgi:hypothetical protein
LLGRSRASIGPVPSPRISTRSITFLSWRTLPGQDIVCSIATASSPNSRRQALLGIEQRDEMLGKLGNVLAPVLQRRHLDRHHVEPVIEFLAEAAAAISCARSRVVDEITRRSTRTFAVPPTRVKDWSTSTRRILDWVPSGMSATSSK